jgi:hypothetical protein
MKIPPKNLISATLAVIAIAPALPAQAKQDRLRKELALIATPAGQQLGLRGRARLEARPDRGREKINVEVQSRTAPAGTTFQVLVVNGGNTISIGNLVLRPRNGQVEGELERKNWDGDTLPPGVSPVASISEVRVVDPANPATVYLSSTSTPPGGGGGTTPPPSGGGGGTTPPPGGGGGTTPPPGGGGGGTTDPVRRRIDLTPTQAGASVRAKGHAEIETRSDGRQKFKVEVEARGLASGTVVIVEFTHKTNTGGPFSFALTLTGGSQVEGEVEFDSKEGPALPAGASPVNGIASITVRLQNGGQVILAGSF